MKTLCSAVRLSLEKAGLFHAQACVLCAVSGGADSVSLLHALSQLRPEAGFCLRAVHVQHGLRGEASREDEAFVRRLCALLDVPLDVFAADVGASMHEPGVETRARSARREIFARCMTETGANALLTAHHRDDQSETVLMHLLRGSGMTGLCGMPECAPFAGGVLLRPFLAIPKSRLVEALASIAQDCREDASNQEALTPRNALRLSVLPQLERLYPQAGAHIAQAADALSADEMYLRSQADRLYEQAVYHAPPLCAAAREPLVQAPAALVRRVLRRCYAEAACPEEEMSLSFADTLALESLLHQPGASHNLPGGWRAVCEATHLHLTQTGPLLGGDEPAQSVCAENREYRFRHARILQQSGGEAVPASSHEAVLTPEILARAPVLRLPRPDDRIQPMGAPGSKSLRRFFTDRKIDPFFRYQRPVLAAGQEILWIPSVCAAEALRITALPPGSIRLINTAFIPFDPHQPKE